MRQKTMQHQTNAVSLREKTEHIEIILTSMRQTQYKTKQKAAVDKKGRQAEKDA